MHMAITVVSLSLDAKSQLFWHAGRRPLCLLTALAQQVMQSSPSVSTLSNGRTNWPLTSILCMCVGHFQVSRSHRIETEGHRSRSRCGRSVLDPSEFCSNWVVMTEIKSNTLNAQEMCYGILNFLFLSCRFLTLEILDDDCFYNVTYI